MPGLAKVKAKESSKAMLHPGQVLYELILNG